jgi:hypothetical protein
MTNIPKIEQMIDNGILSRIHNKHLEISYKDIFNKYASLSKVLYLVKLDKTEVDYADFKEMLESLNINYKKLRN